MAVYLSTSDEMVPILISAAMPIVSIIKILFIKLVIGVIFGFLIDFIYRKFRKNPEKKEIKNICEKEHCNCHKNGIIKSSSIHTLNITLYIFVVTLIINIMMTIIGEQTIENIVENHFILGPIISSLIGLIPNCAASVIITDLYIKGILNVASLISGLLTRIRSRDNRII